MLLNDELERAVRVAYCAGLIDGEGSVSAATSHGCRTNFRVMLSVSMCDRFPLEFLYATFGGHLAVWKRKTKTGKTVFSWTLHCKKAADALEEMLPYLTVKKTRASNAILLARMMTARKYAKMRVLTQLEIDERVRLATLIRMENFSTNGRIQKYAPQERNQ